MLPDARIVLIGVFVSGNEGVVFDEDHKHLYGFLSLFAPLFLLFFLDVVSFFLA